MALSKDALKTAISGRLDTLFADPESPPAQIDVWDAIADEIVSHVVDNLEVNGVTVDAGTPLGAVFTGGTPIPNDGGAALQTAWIAGSPGKTAIQSDDGTGHVA